MNDFSQFDRMSSIEIKFALIRMAAMGPHETFQEAAHRLLEENHPQLSLFQYGVEMWESALKQEFNEIEN